MIAAEVQRAYQQLAAALGLSIVCGQIVLNVNNGDLASIEKIREYERIPANPPRRHGDRPDGLAQVGDRAGDTMRAAVADATKRAQAWRP